MKKHPVLTLKKGIFLYSFNNSGGVIEDLVDTDMKRPTCLFIYLSTGGCTLSVAVVRNSSLDIRSLQGHRSCHSGVRWTAGWSLPLGFLLSRNYLSWAKEHPLSQGNRTVINCQLHFFHKCVFISDLGFQSPTLTCFFSSSDRCQHFFQCQLYSWCWCDGTSSVHFVPGPEVLHTPEELPLRNIPQWALLQQPGSSQVRLYKRSTS